MQPEIEPQGVSPEASGAGPAGAGPAGAGPASRATRSRLPWRRIVLVGLLVVGVGFVGALGYGFLLYDRVTRPDRSAPDVSVDNYLRALLVDRDDGRAALFSCRDAAGLAEIRALRDDIEAREKRFNVTITVSWGVLTVIPQDRRASVTTNIRRTVGDGEERDIQSWQFSVVDDNGWRVCGANRVPS